MLMLPAAIFAVTLISLPPMPLPLRAAAVDAAARHAYARYALMLPPPISRYG